MELSLVVLKRLSVIVLRQVASPRKATIELRQILRFGH